MTYRNPSISIMQAETLSDYDLIAVDKEKIRKVLACYEIVSK